MESNGQFYTGMRKPEAGSQGRYHGAKEVIDMIDGRLNKLARVYPDGIRVGCSFITKDAARELVAQLKERGMI